MLHRAIEWCKDLSWGKRSHAINAILVTLKVSIDNTEAQASDNAGEAYDYVS